MIYNDRLDSPVGHFSSKYCPKTARNEVKLPIKTAICWSWWIKYS